MPPGAIEDPFMIVPEGRDRARQSVADRLAELDRERRVFEFIRAHLHGNTGIGEVLSFFHGQHAECPNEFAESDLQAVETVLTGFFEDPDRYRTAWAEGSLVRRVAEAVDECEGSLSHPAADHVAPKLAEAIGSVIAAEQGAF